MKQEVQPLLRCPRTGQPLEPQGDGWLASRDGACRYPTIEGTPFLIDIEQSVIDHYPENSRTSSPVKRSAHAGLKGFAKRLVSPEKKSTRENVKKLVALLADRKRPKVLVIGGGTRGQGTEALYAAPDVEIIAFDIYLSDRVDFVADAHHIPLSDGSVDAVLVQAVLEHVLQPEQVVREIWRVLADDGIVYAETPFLQQVHEGPYDFTRFTDSGHRYLFRQFALIDAGTSGGPGTQLLWSIDYFVRALFRSRRAGKIAKLTFFWLHYADRLISDRDSLDTASGTYFLGRKSQESLGPRDIVQFYRGAQ